MTDREKEVLRLIEENPMISQNELAEKLNITRSSVAVHIANLMKKGVIKGKGYVFSKKDYVAVIGACNIDIGGFSTNKLIAKDSNPGKIRISFGGVSRNIAENLSRLGVDIELMTVFADDVYSQSLKKNCMDLGMRIGNSISVSNETTATYLYIADSDKDMSLAISDMEIYKHITKEYVETKKEVLKKAKAIVVDTCVPKETLKYITSLGVPVFIDLVSVSRGVSVKDFIGEFHTIKPNIYEAEMLLDMKITNDSDLEKAAKAFINKGVEQVFISLGEKGVYYSNKKESGHLKALKTKAVNTTGAGDSFMAGIVYGFMENMDIKKTAKIGSAAASICIESIETISKDLSIEKIYEKIK